MFLVIVSNSCSDFSASEDMHVSVDLDTIRERGKLVAVTNLNSTDYFIYKGEPMGFNYELLGAFADHIGIDIEIVAENNIDRAVEMLNTGEADILAIDMPVNSARKKEIAFTEHTGETREVLVQRKPKDWESMPSDDLEQMLVRRYEGFAGKTIYVQEGSHHVKSLDSLAKNIGAAFAIVETPNVPDQLLKHVAAGEISYTVCNENIAQVNATYYPGLDITLPVSAPQKMAWGIRKNGSEELLTEFNNWLHDYKRTRSFALLYSKYFKNSRSSKIIQSDYYALSTGKVSRYDELIKQFSDTINWDWRLLASLICQESRFVHDVTSRVGAYGLMQIMPSTAETFGIDAMSSPRNNIRAGVKYINRLHSIFDSKVADEEERMKFILASYNAGPGHVIDAMNLAEKNGMDPQKWSDVEIWLLKKSESKYYNDAVVKQGYLRGKESVAFVSQILDRYGHYKNILPATDAKY